MKMHTCLPEAIWLNTSPSFKHFDRGLLAEIATTTRIGYWEYQQDLDEPSLLSVVLTLVHDYLKSLSQPVHLIGHSTGGLIGLLYARKHPERVKSLTLLAVGIHPAVDWKAHYYVQQQLLPCPREELLDQMVRMLCGCQSPIAEQKIVQLLKQDLAESFSLHSPFQRISLPSGGVPVPLMIGGSQTDNIISLRELQEWRVFFKPGDRLCQFPQGGHFFHYFFPQLVNAEILKFWTEIDQSSKTTASSTVNCNT
ncbi:MAG: alpha/beta fold hydrolase [Microcoleaceae cyanobacterium]